MLKSNPNSLCEAPPSGAISKVVICGGGTAGWMTAAAFSRFLPETVEITLIESDEIGTVGVGEATIPPIHNFNRVLGIDEQAFLKSCNGTFKLGIEFVDWGQLGQRYIHPFGTYGLDLDGVSFRHLYFAARFQSGIDYNLCAQAARLNRFARPAPSNDLNAAGFKYAFHFDAGLYAQFLRAYAEAHRVRRLEGQIAQVNQNSETGFIESVSLKSGETIPGELFIDCTGFSALLIGQTLKVPYLDWSHWLGCDRAWAVPCQLSGPLLPYTRATAEAAGWRWRIPLQNRVGNGYVFSSAHSDEEAARLRLVASLDAPALGEPRLLRFTPGRRAEIWHKNCVAIGLSSGFLEPLESTSIHLIQSAITKLFLCFPDQSFLNAERLEFNDLYITQFDQVRDFIVAHYKLTQRNDTRFWQNNRDMDIPDSLRHKLTLFSAKGKIIKRDDDLFGEDNWMAVLHGQGLSPEMIDPLASALPPKHVIDTLSKYKKAVLAMAQSLPSHESFIQHYCAAKS